MGDGLLGYSRSTWRLMCLGSWWPGSGMGRLGVGAPLPVLPPLPCAHPCTYSRDELKRHYNLGEYWIEVEMEDLASFDEELADYLYKQPAEHLQLVSGTPALGPLPRNPQGWPCSGHSQSVPSPFPAGGSCQGGG